MKNTVLLVIVSCAFATALPQKYANANDDDIDVSIMNGKDAARGQFPYMVSIQVYGKHLCGAAIISSSWLLSAAHCYAKPELFVAGAFKVSKYVAVAGLLINGEKHEGIQTIPIEQVIAHSKWVSENNDIALLKLQSPLSFNDFVKPVDLPQSNSIPTGKAVISGWGYTDTDPIELASHLQYLETNVISNVECNKILEEIGGLPTVEDNNVCTVSDEAHQSACYGDSGGPLVQNNVLIGIVSWGEPSCTLTLSSPGPNVFTSVSRFINFINETIGH